mmetsp:Transcript_45590/g.122920  ORF Transcript_45590/g.122920 Transcript_45590/m.122920 type:complete len:564 (-) Transcript_45590:807-2498(-)
MPAVRHHIAEGPQVTVIHVGAVERDHHPDVEQQRLARGLDAEHLQDLYDVVALKAREVHLWELHHLLEVDTVRIQHPLLAALELTLALVVTGDGVLAHEDFLDAMYPLQRHLLQDVAFDAPQELEVLVLPVVIEIPRDRVLPHVGRFLDEPDAQHELLGVVVREDAVQVPEEVVDDPLADLSHRELLVGHDLVAELDAEEPRAAPGRVVVLVRELVVLADPLLVFHHAGVHRVRVPEDLREGGDLLQRRVLQRALHVLGPLLVLAQVPVQVDRQGGCLHSLGHVDQLLQAGHSQGHVLRPDTGEVERVEGHLCGWLPYALRRQRADHLTRVHARLHEALLDLAHEPVERLLCQAVFLQDLPRGQVAADVRVQHDLRVVLHLAPDDVALLDRARHLQLLHELVHLMADLHGRVLLVPIAGVLLQAPHLGPAHDPGDVDGDVLLGVPVWEDLRTYHLLQALQLAPLVVEGCLLLSTGLDLLQDFRWQPREPVILGVVVVPEGPLHGLVVVRHDLEGLVLDQHPVHAILPIKELDDVVGSISRGPVVVAPQRLHRLDQTSLNIPCF